MSDHYRSKLRPLVTGDGAYAHLTPEAAELALNAALVASAASALIAPDELVDRFTAAEFAAIKGSPDAEVQKLVFRLSAHPQPLNLSSATVQQGLAYMVTLGLLTAERAAVIGAAAPGALISERQRIGWPHERIWAADVIAARAMED